MISTDRPKAKWLLFGIPFVITLHNDDASIIDKFQKCPFLKHLFYSAIDDKIKTSFVAPCHKLHLPIIFILKVLIRSVLLFF